ncbi:hypothetical protein EYF80_046882 [Liparis tanakae]|uniref:Uncharacterized protein n=1 Tax=Liparis tanakae TaxID=230148 RepID=A0A4Z2FQE4_9TELE|nr:hypothetical protein EYF80_046882 [Liparis tanakae]
MSIFHAGLQLEQSGAVQNLTKLLANHYNFPQSQKILKSLHHQHSDVNDDHNELISLQTGPESLHLLFYVEGLWVLLVLVLRGDICFNPNQLLDICRKHIMNGDFRLISTFITGDAQEF